MRITLLLLGLFIFSVNAFGEAKEIRVIFLSRPKSAYYELPRAFEWVSHMIVGNDVECEPYGEGCFHPQLGYIEDPKKVEASKVKKKLDQKVELKTINSEETNLVNCDDKYYFDLYCGKSQKIKSKTNSAHQVWIDISSSMRLVDYSTDAAYCERRRFVQKFKQACEGKVDVYTFNTGRQTMGSPENVCLNRGTNNGARVVQWLKSTEAKSVLIITDADEYIGEFREYLDLRGADIEGIGVKPIEADDLMAKVDKLKKICL